MPLPRGSGFEFEDAIVGGSIPRQFIPAIEKGMRNRMTKGVIAGYPVTDVKVRLFDGKYHDVDSDSRSFEMAGSKAFQASFKLAKPTLLEPIMRIEVTCPDESMGDVIGDLNQRRGRVEGMDAHGKSQNIRAIDPMSESLKYSWTCARSPAGAARSRSSSRTTRNCLRTWSRRWWPRPRSRPKKRSNRPSITGVCFVAFVVSLSHLPT